MARDKRLGKHSKKRNASSRKRRTDSFKHSEVQKKEDGNKVVVKKRKLDIEEEVSDDADETDHFSSLLSSFNIPLTNSVVETESESESEDEDDKTTKKGIAESASYTVDSGEETDRSVTLQGTGDIPVGDKADGSESDDDNDDDVPEDENAMDHEDAADPFVKHLKYDLSDSLLKSVESIPPVIQTLHQNWPILGALHFYIPEAVETVVPKLSKFSIQEDVVYASPGSLPSRIGSVDLAKLQVKTQIQNNIKDTNKQNIAGNDEILLTSLQKEMFSVINNYQDLYFPNRTFENGEEVRFLYCLHSVNHILKTRTKIVHHNAKLQGKRDVPDEFRDQGLVRPKVLILVPFKDSALKIVKMIMALLYPNDKGHIINKARLLEEFSGGGIFMPYKNPRPEDYEKTFSGNTDDNFKIGLSITRKSLKLYVDFYSADIIIASPLGLRVLIGAEGDSTRDYDFLASIEILILDQAEIFLMQNWEHVLHVVDHLHLQPRESHGTDFARVRSWAVNGWTRFYRQTLMFSSHTLPEMNSLFNKKCHNYAGKVRVEKFYSKGSVCQVVIQLPQIFQRFSTTGGTNVVDSRFEYFSKKILPQYMDTITSNVLIYVPSYFDYVRIRNYFKKEDTSFVQICEYTKHSKIARARDMFFHNEAHFLLYSERAHFFRRLRIKGIKHIIFYQPPSIPHFYSELCNFMIESNMGQSLTCESNKNVTVLYAKSDGLQLSAIVGTEKAAQMLSSERDVHMFVSGE